MVNKKFSLEKTIESLESGNFCKIICGAANTSKQQVERIALIYSLCGADVIDIAPDKDVHDAARRGIRRAAKIAQETPVVYPNFKIPALMKSVNVRGDKHFMKASFNNELCTSCLECAKTCPSGALSENKEFDREKCYGCAVCVETCQHNAVSMVEIPSLQKSKQVQDDSFDAVELHTGNSTIEEIKEFLESNKELKNMGLISVSVDSRRFNTKKLIEYVDAITKLFDKKIIIQIDGISMRGGSKDISTLQTLAAAATLIDAKINAYIQLSGGTNLLTRKIATLTGLKISGIGYGTFAKKNILPYIENSTENDFQANLYKATQIAEKLVF